MLTARDKKNAQNRKHYAKHRERILAKQKEYYVRNRAQIVAQKSEYQRRPEVKSRRKHQRPVWEARQYMRDTGVPFSESLSV